MFKFKRSDVEGIITRELKLPKKIAKSFNYIFDKLKEKGHYIEFKDKIVMPNEEIRTLIEKGLFREGKNYHWIAIALDKDIEMLIRDYDEHKTVYLKLTKKEFDKEGNLLWVDETYNAFSIYTNREVACKVREQGKSDIPTDLWEKYMDDMFYCLPYYDFNFLINKIIDMLRNDIIHLLWNTASLPRPERVKIEHYYDFKSGFSFGCTIHSIDQMIFAAEELSVIHVELFAENEMLEKIKTLKVGDMVGSYRIDGIRTELDDTYGAYHGVGVKIQNTKFPDGEAKWKDVYDLAYFYYKDFFSEDN